MRSRRSISLGVRWFIVSLAIVMALGGLQPALASLKEPTTDALPAQGGGGASAETIGELAVAAHLQNLRTRTTTYWIGGALGQPTTEVASVPAGTVINDWQFRDMYDETSHATLDDLTRPILINIWASWCGPCRFEFPFLTDIALNQDTSYDLWFLNSGDTSETAARRFLRTQAEGVDVFYDEEDFFARTAGIRIFPTTMLMDTDGTIIAIHIGIVTPTIMRFFDAVASNPRAGSIDVESIDVDDVLAANIEPVDPETATPIVYGQQVANEISDEVWQHNYQFEGMAGQTVTIEMKSTDDDFDSYLVLIGPDGERLQENDDGPSRPNAFIQQALPQDGTYYIVATRFLEEEGYSRGGFTLTLAEGDTANDPNTAASYLLPNIPVSGRLSRDRLQDNFLFEGQAGQEVTFILEHDQPESEYLNFQVRIGATERIVPFTQTENGELTVTVTLPKNTGYSVYVSRPMASRAEPITYKLRAQTSISLEQIGGGGAETGAPASNAPPEDDSSQDEGVPDAAADDEQQPDEDTQQPQDDGAETAQGELPGVNNLHYGDVVEAEITDSTDQIEYVFVGTEGDVVSIAMEAIDPNLDTMIILYGPTRGIYAANDDNGNTTDSLIPAYTLPAGGIYTIVATRFGPSAGIGGSGAFRLSLTLETAPATTPVESAPDASQADTDTVNEDDAGEDTVIIEEATLRYGETVEGRLTDDVYEVRYTFDGNAGDVVTIRMNAIEADLDAYLSLETATGKQLSYNDDNYRDSTQDAMIDGVLLPDDGAYTIIATRYAGEYGTSTGAFTLTLNVTGQSEPASASQDEMSQSVEDGNPSGRFFEDVETIAFGDEIVGFLDVDTTPNAYVFEGHAGDLITASLKRVDGDLDAGLVLIGPDGEPTAFNQTYTGPADARLELIELTADGEYILVVGLDEETSGNYRLRLILE